MRKILFAILVAFCFAKLNAQDTTLIERVNYLYEDFYNEYYYGSLKLAQTKGTKFMRASGQLTVMINAVGEGNTTVASEALEDLNAIFGTSYGLPTYDFDETSQSYLDIDSIKLAGMSGYVDSILTTAQISAIISDSITDAAAQWREDISDSISSFGTSAQWNSDISDSITAAETQWREDINDSLTAAKTLLRSDISDSITAYVDTATVMYPASTAAMIEDSLDAFTGGGSTDSSFYTLTAIDSFIIGTQTGAYTFMRYASSLNSICITSTGGQIIGDAFVFANPKTAGLYPYLSIAQGIKLTQSKIIPDYINDDNTYYTRVSSDKLGLTAGGQSTFTSEYLSSKKINDAKDSLIVTGIGATRGTFSESITVNGTSHFNIVSYDEVPEDNSIPMVTPSSTIELVAVEPLFSSTTITDSTTSVNVAYANTVYVNDAENCAINGFTGGEVGDIITIINKTTNNLVLKNNGSGTQKIRDSGDLTITGYGGAMLQYDGSYWYIIGDHQ